MDFGNLVNSGLDKVGEGIDAGKEFLGEGIDKGTSDFAAEVAAAVKK